MLAGLCCQNFVVQGANLDRKSEQVDESSGICLVVAVILIKCSHACRIQGVWRCNRCRNDVALVKFQFYITGYGVESTNALIALRSGVYH